MYKVYRKHILKIYGHNNKEKKRQQQEGKQATTISTKKVYFIENKNHRKEQTYRKQKGNPKKRSIKKYIYIFHPTLNCLLLHFLTYP